MAQTYHVCWGFHRREEFGDFAEARAFAKSIASENPRLIGDGYEPDDDGTCDGLTEEERDALMEDE